MQSEKNKWKIDKRVNLSLFVQLVFLASLIIGTWVNLQRQLCLLQYDIARLIETQQKFGERFENINNKCIGFEFRLRSIEKQHETEF